MLNCGITGSTGILGSNVIKNLKFNFIIFKGDITKKKAVFEIPNTIAAQRSSLCAPMCETAVSGYLWLYL